jgi:hypothetical protein
VKLAEANDELLEKLGNAWTRASKRMADEDRPIEVLAHVLRNTDSQWYQLPGHQSWLYIRNVIPGRMADLHALNLDGQRALDREAIRAELLAIMREYELRRLNVCVPAPVTDVQAILWWLGFEAEGRVRDACVFNEEFTDSIVWGILRRDLEHDLIADVAPPPKKEKKRRRRSRRRNRRKWVNRTQAAPRPPASE